MRFLWHKTLQRILDTYHRIQGYVKNFCAQTQILDTYHRIQGYVKNFCTQTQILDTYHRIQGYVKNFCALEHRYMRIFYGHISIFLKYSLLMRYISMVKLKGILVWKRFKFINLLGMLCLLVGLILYWGYSSSRIQEENSEEDKQIVSVEVIKTQSSNFQNYLKTSGVLRAAESVHMQSAITGKIKHIFFESGTYVEEGDPLLALEDDVLRAELHQAKTKFLLAQIERETTERLFQKAAKSKSAYEKAVAEQEIAEASLALVLANLAQTVLRAPFNGVIGLRNVSVGALVRPGESILSIWDIDSIKVDFSVNERDSHYLSVGQTLNVEVDNLPGYLFGAKIEALEPVVDDVNHSILIRGVIDNQNKMLKPGMFARIKIETTLDENIIIVPESAVVSEGQTESVYVVAEGIAHKIAVKTANNDGEYVEILEGLGPDMLVVIEGQSQLQEGVHVKIVDTTRDDPQDVFEDDHRESTESDSQANAVPSEPQPESDHDKGDSKI